MRRFCSSAGMSAEWCGCVRAWSCGLMATRAAGEPCSSLVASYNRLHTDQYNTMHQYIHTPPQRARTRTRLRARTTKYT